MPDYATKNDVQEIVTKAIKKDVQEIVTKAVDDLGSVMQTFMHQVDVRFNKLEAKVDEIDKKYEHLVNTLDSFVARIDHYEVEQAARDNQFEKLLAWARKVSEKTGIPLENL